MLSWDQKLPFFLGLPSHLCEGGWAVSTVWKNSYMPSWLLTSVQISIHKFKIQASATICFLQQFERRKAQGRCAGGRESFRLAAANRVSALLSFTASAEEKCDCHSCWEAFLAPVPQSPVVPEQGIKIEQRCSFSTLLFQFINLIAYILDNL